VVFFGSGERAWPRGWKDRPGWNTEIALARTLAALEYGILPSASHSEAAARYNAFFLAGGQGAAQAGFVWGVLGLLIVAGLGAFSVHRDWLNEGTYAAPGLCSACCLKMVRLRSWKTNCRRSSPRHHGIAIITPLTVRISCADNSWRWHGNFFRTVDCRAGVVHCIPSRAGRADLGNDTSSWVLFWIALMVMLQPTWSRSMGGHVAGRGCEKTRNEPASGTVVRILVVPWLILAGCSLLISLGAMGRVQKLGLTFLSGMDNHWGGGGLLLLHRRARSCSPNFVIVAAQRYISPVSIWNRIFSPVPSASAALPPVIAASK